MTAQEFYNTDDPARWGRAELPDEWRITRAWIDRALHGEGPVVELGCGRGSLAGIDKHSIALDLGLPALTGIGAQHTRVCADMQQLPFANDSVAFIFSWAAIEHVPHPERVLEEVRRVLRPGGVALLAPAWHCRPWAAEGLDFRPYAQLTPSQKVRKAIIPLRNALLWRAAKELPRRALRELRTLKPGEASYEYGRLTPNLTEYVGTDCDAFTSLDPHATILWFATRGWEILSHPRRRDRLAARHEPVAVRKP